MQEPLPTVLIPGLLCTPRLYAEQLPALWSFGAVTVANHTGDASMAGIAQRILSSAPQKFALIGLSMGGYVAFEMLRQAPGRVAKLVLLDTTARPDAPEQTEARKRQIEMAQDGRFDDIAQLLFPRFAEQTGPDAFVRQQTAIMNRADSRPTLKDIRCPTLVVVGADDTLTPPDRATEMAAAIPGARQTIVADCGHLSTLEQPRAVTEALCDFFRA
jgi:pimeloyl-ACP methyl ester carboxylesterase